MDNHRIFDNDSPLPLMLRCACKSYMYDANCNDNAFPDLWKVKKKQQTEIFTFSKACLGLSDMYLSIINSCHSNYI